MNLYHGTLESLVPEILRTGLQPRGDRPSHDAYMDSASMPPFLYLTSSFGVAVQHAVRISERVHKGAPISVVGGTPRPPHGCSLRSRSPTAWSSLTYSRYPRRRWRGATFRWRPTCR